MNISVLDLEREPVDFDCRIGSEEIDYGPQIHQKGDLPVHGHAELIVEHRGPHDEVDDIRLRAGYSGSFELPCARCLEPVECFVQDDVDLVFRPEGADRGPAERSISTSDTEIGYYQNGGLALEDVLREQVLLSLPARTLCREDCKGLCPGCGRNLNSEACTCGAAPADPRWNALADLRNRMKI